MFSEILNLCFLSFKTHKIRSFLSALGVFFGVGAVIGMLSIGEGARKEVLNLIKMMGEKHIILKVSKSFQENGENKDKSFYGLGFSDLRILKEGLPDIKAISPYKKIENIEVYTELGEKTKGNLYAVQKDYKEILNLQIKSGRFFVEEDEKECFNVCVIGKSISLKLFGSQKPEGQKIKILNNWYTVVGTLSDMKGKKGKLEGLETEEIDKSIYVPLRTFLLKEGVKENTSTFDEIAITLNDLKGLKTKKIYIEKLFKRLHQKAEDVEVVVPLLILKQKQETQRIFNIVMACIAGISLLVGGIGIMNIMLASVLERIREIGIRRAVGARKKDIMLQFLLEASFISGIGGLAGIILGFIIAYSVSFFAKWTTTVPLWSIFLSFGISIAVGIIFGYWPSKKGAEANPIEALRYEA